MKTKITLLFLLFAMSSYVNTLIYKVYVWEKYKIQVTVPDDFKVTKNTNEDFEMVGVGMNLGMYIFQGDISMDDLEEATVAGAEAMNLTELDQAHATKINQLEGFYVEGYLDGYRVMFAGLMDKRTKTNLFVTITFADDDENAEDEAFKIINSLKRLM
jgi:hypothetical protein